MPQTITIDPVTRIEGHARISIHLDDGGQVQDARFHVDIFRGFESFCVGRPLWEMPGLTSRICGICPVSHELAAARAGDQILAVVVPQAAHKLRRLFNLGQFVQSHALSYFYLSAPDLLLGLDGDPAARNLFGLIAAEPEQAREGIRLRQFGQEVIERIGGRRIHPAWAVPGGVRGGLDGAGRAFLRSRLDESMAAALAALARFKGLLGRYGDEARAFGDFPSLFMGLVGPDGAWEHYDGRLRVVDAAGAVVADGLDPLRYREFLGEVAEPWSFMKFAYYRPLGYPDGVYRVGPLARLNLCARMGTPLADAELAEYRERCGAVVCGSFFYHYARLIEVVAAIEGIAALLDDPELDAPRLRADAGVNQRRGVGAGEAPRGTLFHEYEVDEHGLVTAVNLLIATGQNNLALNRTVAQIARRYISGPHIPEGMLNRVEAGVRAFDPCLSCATHVAGGMALQVTLHGPDGAVLDEVVR
jgi:NAD-reducing hydrogenase large subunit